MTFFFSQNFQKIYVLFSKFDIPNPVVGAFRVLSGVANLASKYDCSNICSFRDMTFLMVSISFFIENLNLEVFQNL